MLTEESEKNLLLHRLSLENLLTKRVKHNMKHTQTAPPTQAHCTLIDCLKSFSTIWIISGISFYYCSILHHL